MNEFDSASVVARLGVVDPEVDRQARELVAVSSVLTDRGELADFAGILSPEVTWEMPDGVTVGADQVVEGMQGRRAAGHTGPGSNTKHVVTTLYVQPDGEDRALVESIWVFLGDTHETPRMLGTGRYFDTLQRTAAGWQFLSRVSQRG